jgi:galactokinase
MADATALAPGRVNLIGEHTDYHQGFVLPTVIPQSTHVQVTARSDRLVRVVSREKPGDDREYTLGAERPTRDWIDYIQGVTVALSGQSPRLPGFDLVVESDIPLGSGLSSSAALEVSVLRALRTLYDLPFDDVELARLAHRAETEFVGAPVGIMDQMACSVGRPGEALFLDTRSLAFEHVPLPQTAELIVIDSGIEHHHASGAYATRRRESFMAATMLGVTYLRDVPLEQLPRARMLPDPLGRRACHIISENQRVLDSVGALRARDLPAAGRLFSASHGSMRDDYEISTAEIDRLVELGCADRDVYGARLTGGGFGGSVVMLARAGSAQDVVSRVLREYGDGRAATLLPR